MYSVSEDISYTANERRLSQSNLAEGASFTVKYPIETSSHLQPNQEPMLMIENLGRFFTSPSNYHISTTDPTHVYCTIGNTVADSSV